MSDDIVTRLRDSSGMTTCRSDDGFMSIVPDTMLMREAADEIERLQAEIVRLRGVVVLCPKCYEAEHGEGAWAKAVCGE